MLKLKLSPLRHAVAQKGRVRDGLPPLASRWLRGRHGQHAMLRLTTQADCR